MVIATREDRIDRQVLSARSPLHLIFEVYANLLNFVTQANPGSGPGQASVPRRRFGEGREPVPSPGFRLEFITPRDQNDFKGYSPICYEANNFYYILFFLLMINALSCLQGYS